MAGNRWKDIWSARGTEPTAALTLGDLLTTAGWNTFGTVSEEAFRDYVEYVGARLGIAPGDSIFDLGCGTGAFLYAWHRKGHRVAGIDYAERSVAMARAVMPGADLRVGDASQISPEVPFDILVSNGVFLYFPDYDYAADVLLRMAGSAQKAIGILDVPDAARREQALQRRRGQTGTEEYEKRYAGLDHFFYRREWFAEIVAGLGFQVVTENQILAGHFHNDDRFNVFMRRSDDAHST